MARKNKDQKLVEEYLKENTSFEDVEAIAKEIVEDFKASEEEDVIKFTMEKLNEKDAEGSVETSREVEKGSTEEFSCLEKRMYSDLEDEKKSLEKIKESQKSLEKLLAEVGDETSFDLIKAVSNMCLDSSELLLKMSKVPEPTLPRAELRCSQSSKFDWKKYLEEKPELVALNKQMAKKYGLIESEQISKAKEKQVLAELKDDSLKILLLQFFKDIAHIEGFHSIRYNPIGNGSAEYSGLCCEITWRNGQVTSGIGDAHGNNTSSFTKYYLGPIAENRSFVRAVKAYFNIPIVGKDEIGDVPDESSPPSEAPIGPHVTLQDHSKKKLKVSTFDAFKKFLIDQINKDAANAWIQPSEYDEWKAYTDWGDIKKPKVLELIAKVKGHE